jgi:hypothetical protein
MSGFDRKIAQAMTLRVQKSRRQLAQGNKNYAAVSLCNCTVTNPFREFMIKVAVNPWFERFILLVIVANSACLALDDPTAPVRP